MKKFIYLTALALFCLYPNTAIKAQGGVAINAAGSPPDSSALIDLSSTIKGTLITRMTTAQRNAIVRPATGLQIFNTDCSVFNFNAGTPTAPNWATLSSSNALTAGLTIVASPAGAICAGTSVTFSATPSQNNLSPSYQWQVNGSNVGSNSPTYTNSSLNSGDVVSCILTSNAACVIGSPATSNSITVLVNTVPAITGTTAASFCSGNAVTLGASASVGTINWYSVSTGGSSLSTGASFTIAGLNATTTYYVDATANGCTSASRTAVTATSYPSSPTEPGPITGPANLGRDSTGTYSISAEANTTSYTWVVSLGNVTSGQGTTSITATGGDSSGVGSVSVFANNPCGTSVAQTIPVNIGTETFLYTGAQQTFTVPNNITKLALAVYGAQGGSGGGNTGGLGGSATGNLTVTPGEVIYIYVGGQPANNTGGFNGGGSTQYNIYGLGGGGASDVRAGANDLGSRVIVAGGGGGVPTPWTCTGGAGGGITGGNGTSSNGTSYCGQGGTQNSGGAQQTACNNGTSTAGSLGQGGNGSTCDYGAGGGGGYYGGGGGDAGGAGGGSGYIGGVNNGVMQNGAQAGNGYVVINW